MTNFKKLIKFLNYLFLNKFCSNNNKKSNETFSKLKKKFKSNMMHSRLFSKMGNRLAKRHRTSPTISKTILTEDEISLLLSNTTMNREQILDFHSNFLLDCPTGCLTKKDFIKMFMELHSTDGKKQKADKFCDYVFK